MNITPIRNLSMSVQQNKDNYNDNDYNDNDNDYNDKDKYYDNDYNDNDKNQLPGCAMRPWAKPRWKTATTPPPFCPRSESKELINKIDVK